MKKLAVCVLFVLVLTGCRTRLNYETTINVELMDKEFRPIDPISKAQKVFVTATATKGQVSVYVYLQKDKDEAEKAVDARKTSPKILDQKEKTAEAKLSVDIPANEAAIVMIMSGDGKKAEVKLKINN